MSLHVLTPDERALVYDQALNAAVRIVQAASRIESGDVAADHFAQTNDARAEFDAVLDRYLARESALASSPAGR